MKDRIFKDSDPVYVLMYNVGDRPETQGTSRRSALKVRFPRGTSAARRRRGYDHRITTGYIDGMPSILPAMRVVWDQDDD